jgi:hypothetical protein
VQTASHRSMWWEAQLFLYRFLHLFTQNFHLQKYMFYANLLLVLKKCTYIEVI